MLKNFVVEQSSSPGNSASISLAGAITGRVAFSDVFANSAAVFYVMEDSSEWEVGEGTLTHGTPDTLARTTVLANSSGTTDKINFAGSVYVYNSIPASRALHYNTSGNLVLTGGLTGTTASFSGALTGTTAALTGTVTGTNIGQGALVSKSASQAIATSTYTYLTWATENYDDAGIWAVGQPTRLTVPSGFTRARASFSVSWGIEVGFDISILKNQLAAPGEVRMIDTSFVGCGTTPIMAVTAGDYFEVQVYQSSGVSQDVVATEFTWFALELLR